MTFLAKHFQNFLLTMSSANKNIKHHLFEMCKDEETELLHPEKFYDQLHARGIRISDPRISNVIEAIEKHEEKRVDKHKFTELIFIFKIPKFPQIL